MSASAPVSGVVSIRNGCGFSRWTKRIERDLANRGQFDLACAVQHQQKTTADHIAQRAVGLLPVPRFAQFCRKLPAAQRRIRGDELPYENDVFGCDCSASISPLNWHLPPVCQNENRNASPEAIILCAHAPPHGRCFGIRITGREQQLRLMRSQCFRRFVSCRPPLESAFRQALGGDPEPLPVIG